MANASTNSQYKGDVTLKLKLKDNKTVELRKKNKGLLTLSKAFALYISNNSSKEDYIPQFIDLQWIEYPSQVADVEDLDNWESFLIQPVSLSGLSYALEDKAYIEQGQIRYQPNWIAVANARIPYSYLKSHQTMSATSLFRLFLLTKNTESLIVDRRLCYVPITADEINKMTPGSELQVEWALQLVHAPIETQ